MKSELPNHTLLFGMDFLNEMEEACRVDPDGVDDGLIRTWAMNLDVGKRLLHTRVSSAHVFGKGFALCMEDVPQDLDLRTPFLLTDDVESEIVFNNPFCLDVSEEAIAMFNRHPYRRDYGVEGRTWYGVCTRPDDANYNLIAFGLGGESKVELGEEIRFTEWGGTCALGTVRQLIRTRD